MKTNPESNHAKGSSLIEAVIAVGVLAVAVPLVFGTMAQTGESSISSQAETRSSWIVPACVEELKLAMRGQSEHLGELTPGKDFPTGAPVVLTFSSEGKVLGSASSSEYEGGVRALSREPARYVVSMSGTLPRSSSDEAPPSLTVKIVVEYPAAAPAAKRQKIEFHTRLP